MKKNSPCLNCTRVKNPGNCENKSCKEWSAWFLARWADIHGYYAAYAPGQEKGEGNELEA